MVDIHIKARTGADGVLRLRVPTGLVETDVEGRLVMSPVSQGTEAVLAGTGEWPDGFFEATAGRWQGEFERGEPGEFDRRDWQE
jgi:hypothetical protein